jgi:hypothetical protein
MGIDSLTSHDVGYLMGKGMKIPDSLTSSVRAIEGPRRLCRLLDEARLDFVLLQKGVGAVDYIGRIGGIEFIESRGKWLLFRYCSASPGNGLSLCGS